MQLQDIDVGTERAFFSCLHLEEPEDRAPTRHRREWYEAYRDRGYRAQVLVHDDGTVVGKCHSVPVEHSPFVGRGLLAILCIYVQMYEHGIGDQRGRGYGRSMLDRIEQDARACGFKGVVAWAMDWGVWNPVSFYENMGYSRTDQEGRACTVWKRFAADAEAPMLLRLDALPRASREKVNVLVADNAWCSGNEKLEIARAAIEGIEDLVEYEEVGSPWCNRILHLGHVGGVFLDGEPYRPYEVIGSHEELRAEIMRVHEGKLVDEGPRSRIAAG